MLLVDDILLFPFHSFSWLFQKIHQAVQEEIVNSAEAVTMELSELYMMLETGRITEAEFDAQEKELLDRLDAIQAGEGQEQEDED